MKKVGNTYPKKTLKAQLTKLYHCALRYYILDLFHRNRIIPTQSLQVVLRRYRSIRDLRPSPY